MNSLGRDFCMGKECRFSNGGDGSRWETTRNQTSSGIEMFTHPAYLKIIGMGSEVVPLILREMEASAQTEALSKDLKNCSLRP